MLTLQQGNAWLADGIVSFVSRLEVNGQVIIQEAQPLRAVEIALFDRGNLSNDVTFEITTLHPSYALALDFATRRRQTLGNLADLVLAVEDEAYQVTLPGAGWKTTGAKRDGITSIVSYTVRGGQFTVQEGGDPISFGLPVLLESQINPLVIPAGAVAEIKPGQLLVARALVIDGTLNNDAEMLLITTD